MKTSSNILSRLSLIVVACAFVASTSVKAQEVKTDPGRGTSGEIARLIVNRSANFGTNESIKLFVDGTQVAVLGYNQSYNAPLAPGKHLLSISTSPETYPEGTPKQLAITAEPGGTYTFTAVWPDPERAGLIRS